MPLDAHLRRAASFMPAWLRSRLAAWRYGYSASGLLPHRPPWVPGEDALHLSINGLQLTLPRDWETGLEFHLCRNVASRAEMLALIREARRRPGGVLFDVGAEKGLLSLLYCAAAPAGRAVLFEPAPPLVEAERAALARNGLSERAILRHVAVGDMDGMCGGALDEIGFAQLLAAGEGTFQVPMVRLDDEAQRLGIKPAVIKIDVEGHELHVLRGATDLLRGKPVLFMEMHVDLLRATAQDPADLVSLLQRFGYRFYSHYGPELAASRVARTLRAVLRFAAR